MPCLVMMRLDRGGRPRWAARHGARVSFIFLMLSFLVVVVRFLECGCVFVVLPVSLWVSAWLGVPV
jgi:hypothetical protein